MCENNINMDVRWCGIGWINVAQDRGQWRAFVNMEMELRAPYSLVDWWLLKKVSSQVRY
jgi:hypothetical protein